MMSGCDVAVRETTPMRRKLRMKQNAATMQDNAFLHTLTNFAPLCIHGGVMSGRDVILPGGGSATDPSV